MPEGSCISISLEDVDADQFQIGDYYRISDLGKGKQQSDFEVSGIQSLKQVKSQQQRETIIVRDLINVILGKEGDYIRYKLEESEQSNQTKESLRAVKFSISKDIDFSFIDITNKICEHGSRVLTLVSFEQYFNKTSYGIVMGRLCEYFRNFMKEYQNSIFHYLEESGTEMSILSLFQMLSNRRMQSYGCSIVECVASFYDLIKDIIEEDNKRSKITNLTDMKFENLMTSLKEECSSSSVEDIVYDSRTSKCIKGGIILNLLERHIGISRGFRNSNMLFAQIFEFITTGYLDILNKWLNFGQLDDFFDEFFISEAFPKSDIYNSYFWQNKFAIKMDLLPEQLKSKQLQKKLLLTGKYLRIIKECECDHYFEQIPLSSIKTFRGSNFTILIDAAYNRANILLKRMLNHSYEMRIFVSLMTKYFLLTDGSLVDDFLNHANHELKRSYSSSATQDILRWYKISYGTKSDDLTYKLFSELLECEFEPHSILEDILQITRTRVTDVNDIMQASNMESLSNLLKANIHPNSIPSSPRRPEADNQRCNKLAISRFSIDIRIPFPLNHIISDSQKLEFQLLFRHSILINFLNKRFEKSWRELGYHTFWTWSFGDPRVRKWVKRARFIHNRMFEFIRIYLYYLNNDVIQVNWCKLDSVMENLDNEEESFDLCGFKFQMTEFLSSTICDSLLAQTDLASSLYGLFTLILVFHEYVMSLRKTILLMDENLLKVQKKRLKLSITFSKEEKENKLKTLIDVMDSYHQTFQRKMSDLCKHLEYHGKIDSPKMLTLQEKLVFGFNL